MRRGEECLEVLKRSVVGIDIEIVGNVVAVITHGRWIKRQKPDRGDAELLQEVELIVQATEVADSVAVAVAKGLDVQLVDDRVLVPKRITHCFAPNCRHAGNLCRTNRTTQSSGFRGDGLRLAGERKRQRP